MMPAQEQTEPAPGPAESPDPASGRPGASAVPEVQPAENSSPGGGDTPVDLATATEVDITEGSSNPDGEDLTTATQGDTTEGSSNPDSEELDLSLKDIFGEQEEVDESLRDLADSVEEVLAQELAGELREFLEELEARQK